MSTPQEKLERRFRAWWCAIGYKLTVGRESEYDSVLIDAEFVWLEAMKEQG